MTTAPADLVTVQHYAHERTGQPYDALGIIHSVPAGGGYHEGEDLLAAAGRAPGPQYPDTDYSYNDARDRDLAPDGHLAGGNNASAFDLGGEFRRFLEFNAWMRERLLAGDPRSRDIREMIYTLDGQTVRRIDRTGKQRDGGDDSHLYHTHFSFFRDSLGRRDGADNFLGLLDEFFEGGSVTDLDTTYGKESNAPGVRTPRLAICDVDNLRDYLIGAGDAVPGDKTWPKPGSPLAVLLGLPAQLAAVALDAKAAASLPTVVTMTAEDRAAIVAELAALLKPLIPTAAENAAATLDEQHRRDAA